MSDEMREYVTFHVTAKDGSDVEMAVVDEFEYDRKLYVVAAVVKDDVISDEGQFIYRCILKGDDDFSVEPVRDEKLFRELSEAYMAME